MTGCASDVAGVVHGRATPCPWRARLLRHPPPFAKGPNFFRRACRRYGGNGIDELLDARVQVLVCHLQRSRCFGGHDARILNWTFRFFAKLKAYGEPVPGRREHPARWLESSEAQGGLITRTCRALSPRSRTNTRLTMWTPATVTRAPSSCTLRRESCASLPTPLRSWFLRRGLCGFPRRSFTRCIAGGMYPSEPCTSTLRHSRTCRPIAASSRFPR